MKKLGWILLLSMSSIVFAQGRLDGANEPEHSPRLKQKIEEIQADAEAAKKEASQKLAYDPKNYELWHQDGWGFNIRAGFMDSKYNNVDGSLSDGSIIWGFGIYQNLKQGRWKINYALDMIFSKDDDLVPENTRAAQLRVQPEYHYLVNDRFHVFGGLGLAVADYSIRRVISESGTQVISQKFGSGTAFGAALDLGTRYAFNNIVAIDLTVGYLQYFDAPQNKIGGLSFAPRVNFNF